MTRTLFGLVAAGLVLVGSTRANAQLSVAVGNPYQGTGVYVGPSPYGYTYSSGYYGVRPLVPTTGVVYPPVAPVVGQTYIAPATGVFVGPRYRYPVAGVYRYRPIYRRARFWRYW